MSPWHQQMALSKHGTCTQTAASRSSLVEGKVRRIETVNKFRFETRLLLQNAGQIGRRYKLEDT